MTKSRWLLVVALGLLAAVAVPWYKAPPTGAQARIVTEPSQAEPAEMLALAPPIERLPMVKPSNRVADSPPSEAALMQRLRSVKRSDPALAVELARDGNRRFPDTIEAPERASILIHALAQLDRSSEARGEAEHMVNHYPDSEWVREIEGFTGAHRHRNLRLNDGGNLEQFDP